MGAKYSKELLVQAVQQSDSISEVIRVLGGSSNSGALFQWIKNKISELSLDTSHFYKRKRKSPIRRNAGNILICSDGNLRTKASYLKRALLEKGVEYKCAFCGNDGYWIDYKINLDIDHIDCNHKNNLFSNLRFLCPNCHSQKHEKDRDKNKTTKELLEVKKCLQCKNDFISKINSQTTFCNNKCMILYFRENYSCYSAKGNWPNDDILKEMLLVKSVCAVARDIGVSDNAVRKHCKVRGISFKRK